jgi:hypothetical protein
VHPPFGIIAAAFAVAAGAAVSVAVAVAFVLAFDSAAAVVSVPAVVLSVAYVPRLPDGRPHTLT